MSIIGIPSATHATAVNMSKISLRILCLVTAVLCNVQRSLEHEIPKRSFLSRRAIDGSRGSKFFDPNEDGAFDSYGSAGGYYDPYDYVTDLSDIRKNVPGEPGRDYPAYTTLPQTGFTCEGRSRGYYADEALGCQVFHVCHDVSVTSFLCPIGSIFSQKYLTCDWWTKVDCSSTNRYLTKSNLMHDSDDDEMIRNAYAMISLQASAEDVTRDGLVDPDSGARIIDYSALGLRRIAHYPAIDATENDLPRGLEDYPQDNQQIFNYDRYQRKKTSPAYRDKFQFANKEQSPYHASAIIRHDNPTSNNEFENAYRRPDGFTNSLHTSYAPTVPTVTTTTRKFYSPTVPTTYRPSTLAYSKLDLIVDSSDHLYAQSKTPVTPPTISHHNDDVRNINSRESETKHDGLKKSESVLSSRTDKIDEDDDDARSKNDKVHLNHDFRINVTDEMYEDEIFRQQNDRPIIKNDNEESAEDIEARDSIGIAQALNNSPDKILIQSQNPVEHVSKDERRDLTTPTPPQTTLNHNLESHDKMDDADSIIRWTQIFAMPCYPLPCHETSEDETKDEWTETYKFLRDPNIASALEQQNDDTVHYDNQTTVDQNSSSSKSIFNFTSASSVKLNLEVPELDLFLKPPVEDSPVKSTMSTTESSIDIIHNEPNRFSANDNQTTTNPWWRKSIFGFNASKIKDTLEFSDVTQYSAQFLKPPQEDSFINISEETVKPASTIERSIDKIHDEANRFSSNDNQTTVDIQTRFYTLQQSLQQRATVDVNSETTWNPVTTTEISQFHSTPIEDNQDLPLTTIYNENIDEGKSHIVEPSLAETVPPIDNVDYFADVPIEVSYTPIDYYDDILKPYVHSSTEQYDRTERVETQNSPIIPKKNDSETVIQNQQNFTIKIQEEPKTDIKSPISCYNSNLCETSSAAPDVAVSTSSEEEKLTQFVPPNYFEPWSFSFDTRLPEKSVTSVPDKFETFSTQPPPITTTNNNVAEESNLKIITPRSVLGIKDSEEKTEKTANATADLPDSVSIFRQILKEEIKNQPQSIFDAVNDQDFKILEQEDEVTTVSQLSKLSDHVSPEGKNNFPSGVTRQFEEPEIKVISSILPPQWKSLSIQQPRPFSVENKFNTKESTEDKPSFLRQTSISLPQDRNTNFEALAFETLKTSANTAESKTSLNGDLDEEFDLATPPLDQSRDRTLFRNAFKTSIFNNSSVKLLLKPSSDASSSNATEQKTNKSKSTENKTIRPLQKKEILEQLAENFGQPLYSGAIHRPLVFDLPQVQRSLDFETSLSIEESERATDESRNRSPVSSTTITTTQETTTTAEESVKTTVDTEFVPSLGFSFDINADREQYVQAVLEGLIDDLTREDDNDKSKFPQITDKNETPTLVPHKSPENV